MQLMDNIPERILNDFMEQMNRETQWITGLQAINEYCYIILQVLRPKLGKKYRVCICGTDGVTTKIFLTERKAREYFQRMTDEACKKVSPTGAVLYCKPDHNPENVILYQQLKQGKV